MVIAIIGILAAIAMPTLKNFRAGDSLAAATRQLQDDVGRARQYAISERTTVYMVFCPSNFWSVPAYAPGFPASGFNSLPASEKLKAAKLYEKQLIGYTFVTLRSVGEQPGRQSPQYLLLAHPARGSHHPGVEVQSADCLYPGDQRQRANAAGFSRVWI